MAEDQFARLLKHMPDMAEAVKGFPSEALQQEAFKALVAAFHGNALNKPATPTPPEEEKAPQKTTHEPLTEERTSAKAPPRRARRSAASKEPLKVLKDFDLRPTGKKSFADFASEKNPSSNEDKYAVAIYWLEQICELEAVTINHVATVVKLHRWRESKDLLAALRVTASRKSTFDVSDPSHIVTTPTGRNFVEHDLPTTSKTKK